MTKLKTMRKAAGMTQKEFARVCGVKPPLLAMQERYGIKTIRVAKRYAVALKCHWQDIID